MSAGTVEGRDFSQRLERVDSVFPLRRVGVRVFMNPGRLALVNLLVVVCRVKMLWRQPLFNVSVWISLCLILLVVSVQI